MKSAYSAVRTGPLNKAVCASSLEGLTSHLDCGELSVLIPTEETPTTDKIRYICQLQLGLHSVAVVQYTFTHKQYIEQHR